MVLGLIILLILEYTRVRHVRSCSPTIMFFFAMHRWGPYNNVVDKKVTQFIGAPLMFFSTVQKGESVGNASTLSGCRADHQESWSPSSCENNKECIMFDRYLGFVTEPTVCCNLPAQPPLDINNASSYLRAVDLILESGLPNYKAVRIPLPSTFDCEYLEQQMGDYHDKVVLDYIKFSFPLGIEHRSHIISNAIVMTNLQLRCIRTRFPLLYRMSWHLMHYWAHLTKSHIQHLPGHL